MWFLVALVWIALIAGIFWAYGRKRDRVVKAREKEMSALLAEAQLAARATANAPPGAGANAQPVVVANAISYTRKAKFLNKTDAWLYLLFRTGLPDHEIFANVALADVIDPAIAAPGIEREQIARRLAQTFLSIVVCNKQLEIIAGVLYPAPDASGAEVQRFAETGLRAAGIRVVPIDPAMLPRHHQLRALVYGDSQQVS